MDNECHVGQCLTRWFGCVLEAKNRKKLLLLPANKRGAGASRWPQTQYHPQLIFLSTSSHIIPPLPSSPSP